MSAPKRPPNGPHQTDFADPSFKEAVQEEILRRLAEGETMRAICRDKAMPSRETVRLWGEADPEFALAITRAREAGFMVIGEKALEDARNARDPQKGRLVLDATKWYLGKLSKAFADKVVIQGDADAPLKHEHTVELNALAGLSPDERDAVRAILSRRAE